MKTYYDLGKPWESNNLFSGLLFCIDSEDYKFQRSLKAMGRVIRNNWDSENQQMKGLFCDLYNVKLKQFKSLICERVSHHAPLNLKRNEEAFRKDFRDIESEVWDLEWRTLLYDKIENQNRIYANSIINKNNGNTKETKMNLLPIKEAAEKINISPSELYNYIKKGKIKSWRHGKRSLFVEHDELINLNDKIKKATPVTLASPIKPPTNGDIKNGDMDLILKKLNEIDNYEHITQNVLKKISETNIYLDKINFCVKRIYEDLYGIK